MLGKLLASQLPTWGRPGNPVMRTIIGKSGEVSLRRRLLYLILLVGSCVMAVALGYLIARENLLDFLIEGRTTDDPSVREILYYPLIGGQMIAMLLAVALTANTIALEKQKQTWESLKVSTAGVNLMLRARWLSVFFRLWGLLFAITLGRLVYTGYLLHDMSEYQGRAIDLYISGITPEISLDVTILLLTAQMTAFIMMPFIGVALGAALGLLLAVITRTRSIVILGLLLLLGLRMAITIGALMTGGTLFEATGLQSDVYQMSTNDAWARLLFFSVEGDMGLRVMELETLGAIWMDIDNSIYFGGIFFAVMLIQAILANLLVLLSAYWASRPENELRLNAWWTIGGLSGGAIGGAVIGLALGAGITVILAIAITLAIIAAILSGIIVDTWLRPRRYRTATSGS